MSHKFYTCRESFFTSLIFITLVTQGFIHKNDFNASEAALSPFPLITAKCYFLRFYPSGLFKLFGKSSQAQMVASQYKMVIASLSLENISVFGFLFSREKFSAQTKRPPFRSNCKNATEKGGISAELKGSLAIPYTLHSGLTSSGSRDAGQQAEFLSARGRTYQGQRVCRLCSFRSGRHRPPQ